MFNFVDINYYVVCTPCWVQPYCKIATYWNKSDAQLHALIASFENSNIGVRSVLFNTEVTND